MSAVIRYRAAFPNNRATFPNRPNHFIDYVGFGLSEVEEKVSKLYQGGEYRIEQVV